MDSIGNIISTFSSDDVRAFRSFANRQKKLHNRKDLELFSLLLSQPNIKARDAVAELYPDKPNNEAYQALRKKLLRQIMNFLVLKQFDEDTSSLPNVQGLISLSRYLFAHHKDKLAWSYLEKAEQLASETDQFDQLTIIYIMQVDHATSDYAPPLDQILAKFTANKQLADLNERATIALGIIKQHLKLARLSGKDIDFNQLINETIATYDLQNAFHTQARLLYQMVSIVRSSNIVRKDYLPFEPFVLSLYNQFEAKIGFQPKDIEYKIGLQYIIAHTLYRNKRFAAATEYLNLLDGSLQQADRMLAAQYLDKTILLKAANLFFTNQIPQAIDLLEQNKIHSSLVTPVSGLNMCLNSCIYQIYNNDASKACRTLLSIDQSNRWCKKNMGQEWVLKRDLTEVIIQFELGNSEIALNGLKAIERSHGEFMQKGQFVRVSVFLALIRELILHPELAATKEFAAKLEQSFDWLPVEQEDLHAVLFYSWFKSKVLGTPSYQTLLQVLQLQP